ncbi:uncharacterized protein PgNI_03546 [Pyricularia grisea]|uniref:Uncharacterized protein n=1 Tax=Pyricularia grisea TaxID=148305 RepID=A0A6P8B8I6_PYRGI|nr:uncharacterized protein PgNI_03546 [Pyricularia grisea]TLD12169.1 hypothetical protein PgNI_03546 [Pyricularia grisea]
MGRVRTSLWHAEEADGQGLKPCLANGDLFDAFCLYAHNEYDLGMWIRELAGFSKPYFDQYMKQMPRSEPVEQWDDRNRLYSNRVQPLPLEPLPWRDNKQGAQDVRYLVEKYSTKV